MGNCLLGTGYLARALVILRKSVASAGVKIKELAIRIRNHKRPAAKGKRSGKQKQPGPYFFAVDT